MTINLRLRGRRASAGACTITGTRGSLELGLDGPMGEILAGRSFRVVLAGAGAKDPEAKLAEQSPGRAVYTLSWAGQETLVEHADTSAVAARDSG